MVDLDLDGEAIFHDLSFALSDREASHLSSSTTWCETHQDRNHPLRRRPIGFCCEVLQLAA
jgi:hypothetical protein